MWSEREEEIVDEGRFRAKGEKFGGKKKDVQVKGLWGVGGRGGE